MATITAVQSGDWRNVATWDLGRIPQDDDDIIIGEYTIDTPYINMVINCKSLTHNGSTQALGGGYAIYINAENGVFLNGGKLVQTNRKFSINGDVYIDVNSQLRSSSTNASNAISSITGNIIIKDTFVGDNWLDTSSYDSTCTITGNIVNNSNTTLFATNNGNYFVVNGNVNSVGSLMTNANNTNSGVTIYGDVNINTFNPTAQKTPCRLYGNSVNYNSAELPHCDIIVSGATKIHNATQNNIIIITQSQIEDYDLLESDVKKDVPYAYGYKVGTYSPDYPQEAEVLQGVTYDNGNKTGTLTPVILGDYPAEADVKVGVVFDYGDKVGTFQPVADYPAEADVLQGVEYAYGQMTGTLSVATDYPQEANVLLGVEYANGSMVGTLEVVQMQADYPSEDDVRFDIPFDFGNKLGKCHVPIPEDVREGVPVDVNDVGTLIPSSGGDRLRIADFGYYTNAQSDTYIVDLTEQDKPKFAIAEERVLIEMFPDLDLENIPDKYFDDLFVKYLKYRLIVEYYRTAGINSTFTPSEPTTEIVNYQNVRNEVWLNSANIYLKAWGKKYPNSIKEHRIIL